MKGKNPSYDAKSKHGVFDNHVLFCFGGDVDVFGRQNVSCNNRNLSKYPITES